MRAFNLAVVGLYLAIGAALAQPPENADDVRKGHDLAVTICAICHVGAPDQANKPIMKPPAPSFESIARRKDTTEESLLKFMNTTHRGLDNPLGMPNPDLMDYQVRQVVAFILSLRK